MVDDWIVKLWSIVGFQFLDTITLNAFRNQKAPCWQTAWAVTFSCCHGTFHGWVRSLVASPYVFCSSFRSLSSSCVHPEGWKIPDIGDKFLPGYGYGYGISSNIPLLIGFPWIPNIYIYLSINYIYFSPWTRFGIYNLVPVSLNICSNKVDRPTKLLKFHRLLHSWGFHGAEL